eukprot:Macronucleus_3704.p1 GENE.Macronucleus_3704~~Macronucleus_3704.p1  ORF type:complete len:209 (+),score=31.34 Macronucleus_3704:82-627(+)
MSGGWFNPEHQERPDMFFSNKRLEMDDTQVDLQIWDTCGQEKNKDLSSPVIKDAHAFLFTYDITDRDSFDAIDFWIDYIKQHERYPGDHLCTMMILGNKVDRADEARAVSTEDGAAKAAQHGLPFYEVSAKDGTNVEEFCLEMTTKLMHEVLPPLTADRAARIQKMYGATADEGKGCCTIF